jgi:hypothetical protein
MGLMDLLAKAGLAEVKEETPPGIPPTAPLQAPPGYAPASRVQPGFSSSPQVVPADPELTQRLAKIDSMVRDRLTSAIDKAGVLALKELGDTLDTLADAIPDEGARLKAAIKLVSKKYSSGALLQDIDKCIGVLEESDRIFAEESKVQSEKTVGGKTRLVEELTTAIAQKEQQISILRQEIVSATAQRDTEASSIAGEQTKIALVQERFRSAYQAIRTTLESQRAKITASSGGL